jgi:hypothetical protein
MPIQGSFGASPLQKAGGHHFNSDGWNFQEDRRAGLGSTLPRNVHQVKPIQAGEGNIAF